MTAVIPNSILVQQLCRHISSLQAVNQHLLKALQAHKKQQQHVAKLLKYSNWKQLVREVSKTRRFSSQSQLSSAAYQQTFVTNVGLVSQSQSPIKKESRLSGLVIQGSFSQSQLLRTQLKNTESSDCIANSNMNTYNSRQNCKKQQQSRSERLQYYDYPEQQQRFSKLNKYFSDQQYRKKQSQSSENNECGVQDSECQQSVQYSEVENRFSQLNSALKRSKVKEQQLQEENYILAIENTKLRKKLQHLQYVHSNTVLKDIRMDTNIKANVTK